MNWLDVVIVLALAYFVFAGTRHGFLIGILELLGMVLSIGIAFVLYPAVSNLLERLGISPVYSDALAFLIIWFVTLTVYFVLARRLYRRVPRRMRRSRVNQVLGALPGLIRGLIIVAILVTIASALPTPLITDNVLEGSILANPLLRTTMEVTTYAAAIFGEALQDILGFLTIEPEEEGMVDLPFRVENPVVNPTAEEQMLALVNRERTEHGVSPLVVDDTIRAVAREHSIDMFQRGYFAHVDPDGVDPFERMREGGVRFLAAGENIALAPTVEMAHSGLMRSPGHRANILRPEFGRVGIGAAGGGRRGIMFTQNFAN